MKVYYIGDSWNSFPKLIENKLDYLQFHGAGLERIWEASVEKRKIADIVVFTIPGMVRSIQFMNTERLESNDTKHWCNEFYLRFKDDSNFLNDFITYYFDLLKKYYQEQPNLVYFIYSTGGWPYKHPYNMSYHGVDNFQEQMLSKWDESDMNYTYLDLTGKPDMCEDEEDADDTIRERFAKRYYFDDLGWKLPPVYSDVDIFPPNKIVLDHHPSLKADEIASKHIQKYLKKIEKNT